ncbi:hypothetical protein DAEQUDRAFT_727922 [Daedalea quercina L-15889]|uniref:C2H2-type domain-containing protein n=1 Tax=Daedalea quercina L-15889 TaxID=1314783 RepID=A0A165PLF3_9APHY|nr:hypothetical protein DAEQUDRAFT_727922 [Daedalea quercina L-15889]
MANPNVQARIIDEATDAEGGNILCLFDGPCTNLVLTTRSLNAVTAHLDEHHKGSFCTNPRGKYTCRWILPNGELCSAELADKGTLAKHILGAHLKFYEVACAVSGCNKRYSQTFALRRHQARRHPELQLTSG